MFNFGLGAVPPQTMSYNASDDFIFFTFHPSPTFDNQKNAVPVDKKVL